MRIPNSQRNFPSIIGEVVLIAFSILFALFINNLNDQRKFRKVVDRDFIRVAKELEMNISDSKLAIKAFQRRDSIIYLALIDSIDYSDYQTNFNLISVLCGSIYPILDDQSCQNLISANNSENDYKSDLLLDVQKVSTVKLFVEDEKVRMKDFVSDISYPYCSKIFANYVGVSGYNKEQQINDLYHSVTSKEYRTLIYRYAHLNFLYMRTYLGFYKLAIETHNKICSEYNLENTINSEVKNHIEEICGCYTNINRDTINFICKNNSIFLAKRDTIPLLYISDNLFITDKGTMSDQFISFYKKNNEQCVSIHLKSNKNIFTKITEP